MQIIKGHIVTLDNDRKFLVASKLEYNGEQYLYLTAMDETYEIRICLEKVENGITKLIVVEDKDLVQKLSLYFCKDIQDTFK